MEPTVIQTPSGYQVTFKPYVTIGDKRQIQRLMMKTAKIDPTDAKNIDFDSSSIYDAQDLAVKLLIVKIDKPGEDSYRKTDPDAILEAVLSWPEKDGDLVYAKINELTEDPIAKEKKGGLEVELLSLHRLGKGRIPEGFEDVYLCDLLGITFTELDQQPQAWVSRMAFWLEQKGRAEELRQKEQERKAARKR